MAGTVRRQVTLTYEEEEWLQQRARERNISEEELIHEAVRQALGEQASQPSVGRGAKARQEWQQVMALMRARASLPVSAQERTTGRGWTREEIYDERFDRPSR